MIKLIKKCSATEYSKLLTAKSMLNHNVLLAKIYNPYLQNLHCFEIFYFFYLCINWKKTHLSTEMF